MVFVNKRTFMLGYVVVKSQALSEQPLQEVSFLCSSTQQTCSRRPRPASTLGAFNTNNLEWTLAILQAAEEAKSPLILQCTAGAAKWMGGFKVCADMVKAAVEGPRALPFPSPFFTSITVLRGLLQRIEAGFTSIMYDGSHEETFQL